MAVVRANLEGQTMLRAALTSRATELRMLVWFIVAIGAVSIDAVAAAQSGARAPRAALGVMLRDLNADEAQSGIQGAVVQAVVPNGAAEKAGVRAGDIIVGANREAVANGAQLMQMIGARTPGDSIELVVVRSGRRQTISVALMAPVPAQGTLPPGQTQPPAQPSSPAPLTQGSAPASMIRFRPFSIRDPQLNNMEALRLLVPAEWRVEGGIVWRHDRAILATAVLRIFNPTGSEELNFLPIEQFAQRIRAMDSVSDRIISGASCSRRWIPRRLSRGS